MKILITGGTGFLGRHLVWRFAEAGAEVIFTGRNAKAADEVMRNAVKPVQWLSLEHGSFEAGTSLKREAKGSDVVIHCAALSTPWGRAEDFHLANVASTMEVLNACHDSKIKRLVHISTPSLYFDFQDRLNIREDMPLPLPVNEYARTKAKAEELVCTNPAPETVILRPRALFGPWDQTLMPRLLRVMQRGPLPIMRGGNIQLDLTYIDNAVDAVWLAATKPLPRKLATYNVSNGEPKMLLPLLERMAHEFGLPLRTRSLPWPVVKLLAHGLEAVSQLSSGREPLLTRYSAGVLAFSQTLNISSICEDLNYRPNIAIDDGIFRHAQWWLHQPENAFR